MYSVISLLIAATLLGLTSASPLPATQHLATRMPGPNEKLFFTHCTNNGTDQSWMIHYETGKTGITPGEAPSYTAKVQDGLVQWEGNTYTGTFENGVTATSHIYTYANNRNQGVYAGYAQDSVRTTSGDQQFDCFKDDGEQLFSQYGLTCKKLYYCYDGAGKTQQSQ